MVKSSHSSSGGHRLAMGAVTKAAPLLKPAPEHVDEWLCLPPAVTVASSEQKPVLIIAVVATVGLTVLVSVLVGVVVWRR